MDFPRYWPFVRGIHRSPVNSPHKGQWRGPLMFSLICDWTNGWVNNRDAGDLRRRRAHYDVTVMQPSACSPPHICHFVAFALWIRCKSQYHDDVMAWKRITDLLWGESTGHRWIPITKGQWCGAQMPAWTLCRTNRREAWELKCLDAHLTSL